MFAKFASPLAAKAYLGFQSTYPAYGLSITARPDQALSGSGSMKNQGLSGLRWENSSSGSQYGSQMNTLLRALRTQNLIKLSPFVLTHLGVNQCNSGNTR